MTTVNQLPLLTQLAGGDQVLFWATSQGDSRRSPLSAVVSFTLASPAVTGTMTLNGLPVTIGAADSAGTGFRLLRVPNA